MYVAGSGMLVVTLTARRRPMNKGPGIYIQKSVSGWSRDMHESGHTRETVYSMAKDIADKIEGRSYPPTGTYFAKCNVTGADPSDFLQATCSSCECWYCDLN